jgi:D-alanyl-D-alanine carboxypeptidase/D-alanyl-D-alanine-endopeptidase (penicillin-binding protein 4)
VRKLLFLLYWVCGYQTLHAQFQLVTQALDQLGQQTPYAKADISFTLLDNQAGKRLISYQSDRLLSPASTLKTFTTATALKVLGPDFRYRTEIVFQGQIKSGIAKGVIRIYASGDPTFGSDRFDSTKPERIKSLIVEALRKKGIQKMFGKVEVYGQVFDDSSIHSCWLDEDIGNYYGAGLYPLNWRENKFEITLVPTKTSFVVKQNTANYQNDRDFCIELIHKDDATTEEAFAFIEKGKSCPYVIRGVLSAREASHNMQLARLTPAHDFVMELKQTLQREFSFQEMATSHSGPGEKILDIVSPTLTEMVYWCNQKSLNLYAEAFCKTIAHKLFRKGNWYLGTRAMLRYASASGLSTDGADLKDGSGLCENNRITTALLSGMLRQYTREKFFASFYNSLPLINGLSMKSGYIGGTRSYAGYITLRDSTQASFAFIIHGYTCPPRDVKLAMFRILDLLK